MSDTFDQWAIVELMGHRRLAGRVTEQEIAGHAFLRLDVHGQDDVVTQFYSASAVYCITPTDEATARRVGALSRPAPVAQWELEQAEAPSLPPADDMEPPW